MKSNQTINPDRAAPLPLVSVVIVTYKRLERLCETYWSLRSVCRYPNLEWIVCDDGSPPAIQQKIRELPFDKYLLSERNQGMGANTNKGLVAASGEFILQLQDDWKCCEQSNFIESSIELMRERADVSMVQLWRAANFTYPSEYHISTSGKKARIFMDYPGMVNEGTGFYIYSDRPHVKRSTVMRSVGLYSESIRSVLEVEEEYCRRFEQCADQRVAIIEGLGNVFVHTGEQESFNRQQRRENVRKFLRTHPLLKYPWDIYVRLRYGRRS